MGNRDFKKKKENGIYYTPAELADCLTKPLVTNNIAVLDPAYGEGALLLSAEKFCKENKTLSSIHLYGCDTRPLNGLLKHLPKANLRKIDFFHYSTDNK